VTVPRRRLRRAFFWIAIIAILVEVLALTSTFVELHRRRGGSAAGLVPDQIVAVVRLWPSLEESQRGGARLKITVPSADGRGDPRYVDKNAFSQGSFGYRL
jgi:hypothetical protein